MLYHRDEESSYSITNNLELSPFFIHEKSWTPLFSARHPFTYASNISPDKRIIYNHSVVLTYNSLSTPYPFIR